MAVDTLRTDHSRQIRGLVDLCLVPEPLRPAGRRVGDYELLEKIGGGGMGSVWRARQIRLQREVAVKILHEDLAAEPAFTEAFRQEAEITATLKHPGIVSVYEAGEVDGIWFYAMDWVDADNLEEVLREHGSRPLRDAVEMLRDTAAAVGYAHAQGVLHRDLKPSNLLIDAVGQVRVLDFGLARWIGPVASGRTAPLLGTPHYVAPEQAAGNASGPPADVYSLGAVLYRMLGGRVPFSGETPMAVLDQARTELPVPLRRLNPSVPHDIEMIVAKCLEKSPALRYPDASSLAADLTRWLDGRPVTARPVNALGHFKRWVKREPFMAALAAVLTLGVAGTWWQFSEASQLRQAAKRDREMTAMKLTATTLREGHRAEAIRLFSQTMDAAAVDRWGFPARWMRHELNGRPIYQEIIAHQDKIWGMTLADGDRALVTTSEDGSVAVRDVIDGQVRFSLKFPNAAPFGVCAYSGGRKLLISAMNGESKILDPATRSWLPGPAGLVATWTTCSPNGQWWAALRGNPHFWEKEGEIRVSQNDAGATTKWRFAGKRAAFSPDGTLVAIGRAAGDLRTPKVTRTRQVVELYDLATGAKRRDFACDGNPASVRSLAWSGDGKSIAAAEGNRIHRWEIDNSEATWTSESGAGVWQVGFSGSSLLAACSDQTLHVLDAVSGAEINILKGHQNEVWCAQMLPDGRLATGAKDGRLLLWPGLDAGKSDVSKDLHTRGCFAADGSFLSLDHGFLRVTSPEGESHVPGTVRALSLHGWDVTRHAVLAGGENGDLIWLDARRGAVVHRLNRIANAGMRDYATDGTGISADGKLIYEITEKGIYLREPANGKVIRQLPSLSLPLITASMSQNAKFLLASSAQETRLARLYDITTGHVHFLRHGSDEILTSAFSPDQRWLATGGGESAVYVWDLHSDLTRPTAILEGHLESVNGLAFTPDGKWLVSAGSGESLRFWHAPTWESGPAFPCPMGDAFLTFNPAVTLLGISTTSSVRILRAP